MLVFRCKILDVHFPSSLSLGIFVKHLPLSRRQTFQEDQIHLYVDALLQWNEKTNLTAENEVDEVMERHIEEFLEIIPPMQNSYISSCNNSFDNLRIVDVGSSWEVTLVESMKKRCLFLEHAVSLTGLLNVQVVRERAENLGQDSNFREKCDVAVARRVVEMRVLAKYCLPLVRVGGLFVAAKGHHPQVFEFYLGNDFDK